jgi:Ca2+-binding RTX toxin-like protein
MSISTNGTMITRVVGALYNQYLSNASYTELKDTTAATAAGNFLANDFAGKTDAQIATTILTNLGLTSIAGLNNYVAGQLTAAGTTTAAKGAKLVEMLNGYAGMTADATYGTGATSFNAKVIASLGMSQTTGAKGGSFATADVVTATNGTFTLTTGTDSGASFTGGAGDDAFNGSYIGDFATGTSVTPGDNLVGGAGTDTLTISVSGTITTGTAETINALTLSGVENVMLSNFDLQEAAGGDDHIVDMSAATGVAKVGLSSSAATGDTSFINLANAVASEMAGSGDLEVRYQSTLLTGLTDEVSLTLKSVGTSGASADFMTYNGAATGVAETLNVSSTVATNYLTINANNDHKTIKVSGDKELRITNTLDTTVTSVDASTSTGGVQIIAGVSNINVLGGSGNDVIDMVATLTTSDTIDGGAGTDTLAIADPANLVASLKVSNIETVRLAATSATSYDLSYLAGYTSVDFRSNSNAAITSSNVAEGTAVAISADNSNTITHGVKDAANAATTNAATVTIDHGTAETDTDVGTLVLTGIETVSLVSAGVTGTNTAADKLAGTDTTSTINSVATLTAAAATTINVSGAADFQLAATGATLTALTAVNASTLTGSLIYTNRAGATAATTITGGSAADAITGRSSTDNISGGAGNDSITGSGGNDTLAGGDGADTITAGSGNDVITGGDGNDSITGSTGNDNISGDAGNDTFVIDGADITAVLTNNDTLSGGDGTDSLRFATDTTLDLTDAAATAALTNVTGIERLVVNVASATLTINDNIVGIAGGTIAVTNTTTAGVLAGTLAVNASGVLSSSSQVNTTVEATTAGVVTYTLGNAKDNVNLANSTGANIVVAGTLGYFGANDTLVGGSGTDDEVRFSHTTGQTVTAAQWANVTGFEEILVTAATGAYTFTLTDDVLARNYDNTNSALEIGHATNTNAGILTVNGSAVTSLYQLSITGGAGNDVLTGGAGNDTINVGTAGVKTIDGGAGTRDLVDLSGVAVTGDDGVVVNVSGSTVTLATAIDAGGFGANAGARTGEQSAVIATGSIGVLEDNGAVAAANTSISTVTGVERFTLGAGIDYFMGSTTAESVTGGAGADIVISGGGADTVNGGDGSDTIYGQDGADTLNGDADADVIQGGSGADTINGGASATTADTLTGGSGNDIFVFSTRAHALGAAAGTDTANVLMDRITDFVVGSDKIQLALTANAFGTSLTFTADTVVNINTVTALGDATYAGLTNLVAAVQTARTGVASSAVTVQAYVVTTGTITTSTGFSNKTLLIINDDTAGIAVTDTIIDITGVDTTTLTAGSFIFG